MSKSAYAGKRFRPHLAVDACGPIGSGHPHSGCSGNPVLKRSPTRSMRTWCVSGWTAAETEAELLVLGRLGRAEGETAPARPRRPGHRSGGRGGWRGAPALCARGRTGIGIRDEDEVVAREGPFRFFVPPERTRIPSERTRASVLAGKGPARGFDESGCAQLCLLVSALLCAVLNPATPPAEPRLQGRIYRGIGRTGSR